MTTFTQPMFWSLARARSPQHVALKPASAPSVEPLTYADVKAFLRLPNNTDEVYVTDLIKAARQKVETDTGLGLITQAWDLFLDAFPSDAILVPIEPLLAVTSIKTTSAAGVESTLAATNYQVDVHSSPPRIVLSDTGAWPTDLRATQPIAIRLSVGYGAAGTSVPGALLQAMREAIRLWYVPAGGQGSIPTVRWLGYDSLIERYRLERIA